MGFTIGIILPCYVLIKTIIKTNQIDKNKPNREFIVTAVLNIIVWMITERTTSYSGRKVIQIAKGRTCAKAK